MDEIIKIEDKYYIHAGSALSDNRTRIIKKDELFGMFDVFGDVQPIGNGAQGIYFDDTRFLSYLQLNVEGQRPLFLSSNVRKNESLFTVDLANPDIYRDRKLIIPQGSIHIHRSKFFWEKTCYEVIKLANYVDQTVQFSLSFSFSSDYLDIFEVRGQKRSKRGTIRPSQVQKDEVILSYEGLDGLLRNTRLAFSPAPLILNDSSAEFSIKLMPKKSQNIFFMVTCRMDDKHLPLSYREALEKVTLDISQRQKKYCNVYSTNEFFNEWLNRSTSDLQMLMSKTEDEFYPYAGLPWYNTTFGRDGIITALQVLWINPSIAKGVLHFLACTQATEHNKERDAEPGKVLHEARRSEMARTNEIPFGCYYGTVDATPLFIVLAGHYFETTGDLEFIAQIWPNIKMALTWIDLYGDRDRDGLVEYYRESETGLSNQGWKDSFDSVFNEDGQLAKGPLALCEVQGYVYDAKIRAAALATQMGELQLAQDLMTQAQRTKEQFEKLFWSDKMGFYALALDGKKRPCHVYSSNPGHCLFSGIISPERAPKVVNQLFRREMFSGWGIRTVATTAPLYNPMSYHNGSVWPHDNSLIALGLARYGFKNEVLKLLTSFFEASNFVDLNRLPELFCGFAKRPHEGPTLYPVACIPQAWSSGAVYSLIQAALGLKMDALQNRIYFYRPVLPDYLEKLVIENLRLKDSIVDLALHSHYPDVGINIQKKIGPVEIVSIK